MLLKTFGQLDKDVALVRQWGGFVQLRNPNGISSAA
jgi:hypothetical protein